MASSPPELLLHLVGPAHVQADGQIVHLRHKGLAILCVLALDGSVRRERLADLLWESPRAMENLRVELHRLRQAFRPFGLEPFGTSTDPLRLDDRIVVSTASATGTPMEGLDDLAPEFQAWLEYKRSTWAPQGDGTARYRLVDELVRVAAPGLVIVLQGSPGSGRIEVAKSLAHRLALPFVEGPEAAHEVRALRYVDPESCDPAATSQRITRDGASVWVVARSTFGEDPSLLLRLRAALPPERLRFERLAPLTWDEARRVMTEGIAFDEAATLYLASAGNPGYLGELVALRGGEPIVPPVPIPQRLRAAYELEARRLSKPARQALERLSLVEGAISSQALEALGAASCIDELERCGWLLYQSGSWTFADAAAAQALQGEIHEGERERIRSRIQSCARDEGHRRAAGQRRSGGLATSSYSVGDSEDPGRGRPSIVTIGRGHELWLDDARVTGTTATLFGDTVTWAKPDARADDSGIAWSLPETPVLLRFAGRVVGGNGDAATRYECQRGQLSDCRHDHGPGYRFRLSLVGAEAPDLLLGTLGGSQPRYPNEAMVPLADEFELWFLIEAGHMLRLSGTSRPMVSEFTVHAHRSVTASRACKDHVRAIAWCEVSRSAEAARP